MKFLKTAKSTVCTGRPGCKLTCNRCSEVRPFICIHLTKQQRQVACIPLPTACVFCSIRWWCKQITRSGTVQTCWNELLCCWWQRIWIPQRLKFCIFVIFIVFVFFIFDWSERYAQLLVIYNPSKMQGGATITNPCWRSETKIGGQMLPLSILSAIMWFNGFQNRIWWNNQKPLDSNQNTKSIYTDFGTCLNPIITSITHKDLIICYYAYIFIYTIYDIYSMLNWNDHSVFWDLIEYCWVKPYKMEFLNHGFYVESILHKNYQLFSLLWTIF